MLNFESITLIVPNCKTDTVSNTASGCMSLWLCAFKRADCQEALVMADLFHSFDRKVLYENSPVVEWDHLD